MRKNTYFEKMFRYVNDVKSEHLHFFENKIHEFEMLKYSSSKGKKRLLTLKTIYEQNNHSIDNLEQLYNRYWNSRDACEKLRIKYGDKAVNEYQQKLKARPKSKTVSCWSISYWLNKGLSVEEAEIEISKLQKNNTLKRDSASYKNCEYKLKSSVKYWTHKGYSLEEAEILRLPYVKKYTRDLASMIERHGIEEGTKRYHNAIDKYKKTCLENMHLRRTAGYVSTESKLFFIKLYKVCRKLGLSRDDIYFGINGSKEFFIRHDGKENRGRFFDFCVPKLKLVIEYNGRFWHPSDRETWKNPWLDYDDAMAIEEERSILCNKRGFDLYVVWSDDNLKNKINELTNIIKERFNGNR